MQFSLPRLQALLQATGIPAPRQAVFDNLSCEERVNPARLHHYETFLQPHLADGTPFDDAPKSWADLHKRYFDEHIASAAPATFEQADELTARPAIAENDWIVRVERIDRGFERWDKKSVGGKSPVDLLQDWCQQLAAAKARKASAGGRTAGSFEALRDMLGQAQAPAIVEELFEHWNDTVRKDSRPSFVAFEAELTDQVQGDDWPALLCERLGLGHYYGEAVTLALLRYQVKEVLHQNPGKTCFCAPTVLDSQFGAYFHPAPQGCDWGFAAVLNPAAGDDVLVAELLHRRIDYRPQHLWKVGTFQRPGIEDAQLLALRNAHIARLRRQSGRADFGTLR